MPLLEKKSITWLYHFIVVNKQQLQELIRLVLQFTLAETSNYHFKLNLTDCKELTWIQIPLGPDPMLYAV